MASNSADKANSFSEILLWVKAAIIPNVKDRLDKALTTEAERRAYDAADGEKSNRELATLVGKSPQLVSVWSKKWRQGGLASLTIDGRLRHLQSLEAFGLGIDLDEVDE